MFIQRIDPNITNEYLLMVAINSTASELEVAEVPVNVPLELVVFLLGSKL